MNTQEFNNNKRQIVISQNGHVETPAKQQKVGTNDTSEATEIAHMLADIGKDKFYCRDYHSAHEYFSQALCRVDIDYLHSKVKNGTTNNNEITSNSSDILFGIKQNQKQQQQQKQQQGKQNIGGTEILKKDNNTNDTYTDTQSQNENENKCNSTQEKPSSKDQQHILEYDEGMKVYQNILQIQHNKTTSVKEITAILCYNIGQTFVKRQLYDDAIFWFHKSLDQFLSVQQNNNKTSIFVAINLNSLAFCLYITNQSEPAKIFYQRAIDVVVQYNLGIQHLAASTNCLGVVLFNQQQPGNSDLAMEMFLQSFDLYKKCCSQHDNINNYNPNNGNIISTIATVMNNIGRVHYLHFNFDKAVAVYKECLQLRQKSLGSDSVDVAATASNLGQTLYQLGYLDDALCYYQDFLNIMTPKQQAGLVPSKDVAFVYKSIADIYNDKFDHEMALQYYKQALQINRAHSVKDGNDGTCLGALDIALIVSKMGNLCYQMKDYVNAMEYYQQGLKIENSVLEPNHPHIIITTTNIAHIHKQLGQYKEALLAYQQVHQMQQIRFGEDNFVLAETMSSIGLMQYHLKKYEESFDSYQQALCIRRQYFDSDDHAEIASTLNSIGLVLFKQEIYDLAKNCFTESLRIRTKILGKDHRSVAILWYNIATIHFETGEDELAVQMYKETLRVERCALGNDHPDVVLTLQHLGQVHQQLGLAEQALQYFNEALRIVRKNSTKEDQDHNDDILRNARSLGKILNLLGNVYLQMGMTCEMMECYVEASRIYDSNRSLGETVMIGGYNFYGLSKTNPPCAPVA